MSKDFYMIGFGIMMVIAIGQHLAFAAASDRFSAKWAELEEIAEMQNGWVYIEVKK